MRFTSIIVAAALSLSVSAAPWTYSNGVWVANNNFYTLFGTITHEACTRMNTDQKVPDGSNCAYFTNANGGVFNGHCRVNEDGTRFDCI